MCFYQNSLLRTCDVAWRHVTKSLCDVVGEYGVGVAITAIWFKVDDLQYILSVFLLLTDWIIPIGRQIKRNKTEYLFLAKGSPTTHLHLPPIEFLSWHCQKRLPHLFKYWKHKILCVEFCPPLLLWYRIVHSIYTDSLRNYIQCNENQIILNSFFFYRRKLPAKSIASSHCVNRCSLIICKTWMFFVIFVVAIAARYLEKLLTFSK